MRREKERERGLREGTSGNVRKVNEIDILRGESYKDRSRLSLIFVRELKRE